MLKPLTEEEKTVLEMLGQGDTMKKISEVLGIPAHRVSNVKAYAIAKLEAANQVHAVYLAMSQGLIE